MRININWAIWIVTILLCGVMLLFGRPLGAQETVCEVTPLASMEQVLIAKIGSPYPGKEHFTYKGEDTKRLLRAIISVVPNAEKILSKHEIDQIIIFTPALDNVPAVIGYFNGCQGLALAFIAPDGLAAIMKAYESEQPLQKNSI